MVLLLSLVLIILDNLYTPFNITLPLNFSDALFFLKWGSKQTIETITVVIDTRYVVAGNEYNK